VRANEELKLEMVTGTSPTPHPAQPGKLGVGNGHIANMSRSLWHMTTTGPFLVLDMTSAFGKNDAVFDVQPVIVAMLTSVRNTWGGAAHTYDSRRGFFKNEFWAKWASEQFRTRGTSFLVDEVPALRVHTADQSFILLSFNYPSPFEGWSNDLPQDLANSFRVGIPLGEALRLLSELESPDQSEDRGVAVLAVGENIELARVEMDGAQTWGSEPGRPRQEWYVKHQDHFFCAGTLEAAALFRSQSIDEPMNIARGTSHTRANGRPNLTLVPRP
jgi:hypothetical protein